MVAGVLLLVMAIDCAVTVYLVARYRGFLGEVRALRDGYETMAQVLRDTAKDTPLGVPCVEPDRAEDLLGDAQDVLTNASEEDLAAARKLLESLGIGG